MNGAVDLKETKYTILSNRVRNQRLNLMQSELTLTSTLTARHLTNIGVGIDSNHVIEGGTDTNFLVGVFEQRPTISRARYGQIHVRAAKATHDVIEHTIAQL